MRKTGRTSQKRTDFLQNIAIVLLTLSACFLFARTQLYSLGSHMGSGLRQYLSGGGQENPAPPETLLELSAPLRAAVTGVYGGRYGDLALTTASGEFEPLGSLLRESFGSAQEFLPCGRRTFFQALEGACVYCDFLEPLPLTVLAGLVGASLEEDEISVRQTVISGGEGEAVMLYLWDGEDAFFSCKTAVSQEELESITGSYEVGGAFFAMDREELGSLAPCSLFLQKTPEVPSLSATAVLPDTTTLLTVLGFPPRTNSRYREPGGAEVVTEGDRTLRISTDGAIHYRDGGVNPLLRVSSAGESPDLSQAVTGSYALLSGLLTGGSGGLYLTGVQRREEKIVVSFDYQVGGLPVRFFDGAAAQVTLSGSAVTGLSLRYRQFAVTGEPTGLLPLRQAAAIARRQAGAELFLGYLVSGTGVRAAWLTDK